MMDNNDAFLFYGLKEIEFQEQLIYKPHYRTLVIGSTILSTFSVDKNYVLSLK